MKNETKHDWQIFIYDDAGHVKYRQTVTNVDLRTADQMARVQLENHNGDAYSIEAVNKSSTN